VIQESRSLKYEPASEPLHILRLTVSARQMDTAPDMLDFASIDGETLKVVGLGTRESVCVRVREREADRERERARERERERENEVCRFRF